MKVEIFRHFNWRGFRYMWYFRIKAVNGEIVAQSEGYTQKHNARGTATLLIQTMASAQIIEVDH